MSATTTNIGKVAVVPKGVWDETAVYELLNVVTKDGSSYMAVQESVPAGTAVTNSSYWQLVAAKGDRGPADYAQDCAFEIVYESGVYYLEWIGVAGGTPYVLVHEGTDYVLYLEV